MAPKERAELLAEAGRRDPEGAAELTRGVLDTPVASGARREVRYDGKKVDLSEVSWLKRLFQAAHTKMDHDPEVWALVERLILGAVPAK
jgi:hypothetical protein